MNRLFKYYFLILFLAAKNGFAQQKYVLGKVLDAETQKGVELAIITNQRSKQVTRSNKKGTFFLYANTGDSLIVSNLNGRAGIKWDGETQDPVIFLKQSGQLLPEVIITTKREELLRREIQQLLQEPEARKNLSAEEIVGLAMSPVTLLYELFSRRARSDRKVLVLMQEARRRK